MSGVNAESRTARTRLELASSHRESHGTIKTSVGAPEGVPRMVAIARGSPSKRTFPKPLVNEMEGELFGRDQGDSEIGPARAGCAARVA
jgi:hypothetical protein